MARRWAPGHPGYGSQLQRGALTTTTRQQQSRQCYRQSCSCVLGPPQSRRRSQGGCPLGGGFSGSLSSGRMSAFYKHWDVDNGLQAKSVLTQDLTPPISPIVYPVMKSFVVLPSAPGDLGPRFNIEALDGRSPLAEVPLKELLPVRPGRAGLWGLLVGQNPRSSLPSSCPVVDQLVRMLSRSSWT